MEKIPLFQPQIEINYIKDIKNIIIDVINSGYYINSKECSVFENKIEKYLKVKHCISVSSGTSALELMLKASGIKRNNKIFVTANTFVADIEAIINAGFKPEFVDIDEYTWQMPEVNDCNAIVLACHLYGGITFAINSNCKFLFEDASQSFGATYKGKKLGSFGFASAISLYPTKNLSALGDAGMITTNEEIFAQKVKAIRNHGQSQPQHHEFIGTTSRMDEIQARILIEKLKYFDIFIDERQKINDFYRKELKHLPIEFPTLIEGGISATNLFVIKTERRDELKIFLKNHNIDSGIHYPTPIHKMPAYKNFKWAKVDLPKTEKLLNEILTIPLWVGLTQNQKDKIIDVINDFFTK